MKKYEQEHFSRINMDIVARRDRKSSKDILQMMDK